MRGVDVVISALNTDGTTTLTDSMPLIIKAMKNEGIKVIITIGTAGILQSTTRSSHIDTNEAIDVKLESPAARKSDGIIKLCDHTMGWAIADIKIIIKIVRTEIRSGPQEDETFRLSRD
jgi:uncharacterized protein